MYIVNRTCLGVFNLELIEEVPLKITMLVSYTLGTVSSWPSLNLKRTEAVFKLATYPLVLLCCCWSCALYFMYVISIILIPREFPRQQLPMQFKLEISWPYSTKLETSKFVRNYNWTKLCMPNIYLHGYIDVSIDVSPTYTHFLTLNCELNLAWR